ncbi:MAG TPA: cysteine peptidase family C39 domain-containing protein [Vicinamibacteria bacterium]|nr:cysteine peptidase family C39 domain-containing protein [Vicinamibacteria bacterium]
MVADVPFIAQTVDLCGGAAAAMVLRYWGVEDVQAQDFAPLVNRETRGITTGDLAAALGSRGLAARPINAEAEDARREIGNARPVIALIDGGGGRFHYVVIVAWANRRVLFHDPSVGPFRLLNETEFLRLWKATGGFALVVTPGTAALPRASRTVPPASVRKPSECDPLVDHAIEVARGEDPELAVTELAAAGEMCPSDARALDALAGVRFRQKRWAEAAAFARQATERDPTDAEAWRLLGASLYLADDPRPALEAWNRVDEPRVDRVEIEGLDRTRADVATAVIGLHPRDPLTLESIRLAERRLDQLPTAAGGKVTYRPRAGGRADVVAAVGEGGLIEPRVVLALRLGAEFVGKHEARLRINSPTGRGEAVELGGRFESHRPSAWASIETPRLAGLPGVMTLSGVWDRQTYEFVGNVGDATTVETRRRGALDWSHWLTSSLRLEVGVGAERFDAQGSFVSMRGAAGRRLFADRVALVADGGSWMGLSGARGFSEFGGTAAFRSGARSRRWALAARFDGRRATGAAPMAVWPSAGTGASRAFLLRGSPLVSDGIVVGEAFGRGLLHATAEAEMQVAERMLVRLGVAAFADWAKPWDSRPSSGPGQSVFAIGAGLRIRAPGSTAFRFDVAKRPGSPGVVVSAGVIPPWPR